MKILNKFIVLFSLYTLSISSAFKFCIGTSNLTCDISKLDINSFNLISTVISRGGNPANFLTYSFFSTYVVNILFLLYDNIILIVLLSRDVSIKYLLLIYLLASSID